MIDARWLDPAYVAEQRAAHPDAGYFCSRYDESKPHRKKACLRELTLKESIFHCPVHGKEIAE